MAVKLTQKKGRNRAALRPDKHIWGHGLCLSETNHTKRAKSLEIIYSYMFILLSDNQGRACHCIILVGVSISCGDAAGILK
ncbi:MAG: hypothetical protein GXP08_07955 [Gammaproteobacteria bacterium]|nr:hypothetical protein [Gammaproteobacteria bacterium]